jgi:transposase
MEVAMPKVYSRDLRERVVSDVESGMTKAEASRRYRVGYRTVARWCVKKKRTGSVAADRVGRTPGKGKIDLAKLERAVEKDSDATLKARGKNFGVSDVAILKAMRRLNIAHKKNAAVRRAR